MTTSPYYDLVPKDPVENLKWRIRCRERALNDLKFQDALYQACMSDICFWMGFGMYGYDPRSKNKIVPFIPYSHQEYVFKKLDEAFEYTQEGDRTLDVLVDKARAQGGTFGYLWVDLRRWLRDPMFSAGYVTRNADLVDSKTDSDTVLWKVQFAINMLPVWMRPRYERNLSQHTFENKDNGALLKGYSAGQDVAAGGRASVFTMDEAGAKDFVSGGKDYAVMEALHDVSHYLRLVSARYVDQGVFHEACEAGGTEGGWHLVLDWKDHPIHSKHSYVVMDNVVTAVKPEDAEAVAEYHKSKPHLREFLEKKGFKYEGVVRSPWYDMRCLRKTARPQLIASQLDRNPKGAVGKVFTHDLLERMKKVNCKQPVWRGNPVFDSETLELKGLIPRDDGALKLWFRPGIDDSPPLGPYTLACDIASGGVGVFASNSVVSGIDDRTGEQVLEYVVKGLEPRPFARIVVGLCLWLGKAKLGWEDSGVSGGFAKEVMEVLYYGNIYFRNVMQLGTQKKSRKPGFPCRDVDKADMFEQFALAMEQGSYTPRSNEMLVECGEYEWDGGKIVHAPSKNKGAVNKNHGDRCVAGAGAWLVYSADNIGKKVDTDEEKDKNPEYGSFLWREMQERRSANSGSPGYGIRDVLRG
jgi:hypothetical protein